MGKKNAEAMAKERTLFVDGAVKNGTSKEKATEIFDLMEKFAEYGFNKSHSAAYALISYHTAYLKTHHKVEFMAALLTSEIGNQDKILKYIAACKDNDIEVRMPRWGMKLSFLADREMKRLRWSRGWKNGGEGCLRSGLRFRPTRRGVITRKENCWLYQRAECFNISNVFLLGGDYKC